jgi:class 3 adenylate cyclase
MASSTRRLAAILAADVAGYSRLMGADEVGTVQALHEHRAAADPLIAEHGGRIVKTTGDGLLIEFGSVVVAVECALGLQALAAERNAGPNPSARTSITAAISAEPTVGAPTKPYSRQPPTSPAVRNSCIVDNFGVLLRRRHFS